MKKKIERATTRLRNMGQALRMLETAPIDHANEAQEEDYYRVAGRVVELVIHTPAFDIQGLQTKAEAVAWCCASRIDFALGDSSQDLLIGSLLRDLLGA